MTWTVLKIIGEQFIEKYRTHLKYFSGKISDFDDFSVIIDEIVKKQYGLVTPEAKKSDISFDPLNSLIKYIRRPELVLYNIVDRTKDLREKTVKSYRDIMQVFTNRRRYELKEKVKD